MPKPYKIKNISRILDANLNRAKEGLRVCEEITRFILNSPAFTQGLKELRHRITALSERLAAKADMLQERDSLADRGKNIYGQELKREDTQDIFFANIQRAKESLRVLEEFSKLKEKSLAREFKDLRYSLYELEKKIAHRLLALR